MKSLKIPCSVGLALLGLAAMSFANDAQQIRRVYSKLAHAMISKSVDQVKALEGPRFTDTEHGQTMDAAKANSMMAQEFKAVDRFSQCDIDVTSIKISGKTAVTRTTYTMAASLTQNGKKHKLRVVGKSEDHLLKTRQGWLFTSTRDTEEHATLDGKPVKA